MNTRRIAFIGRMSPNEARMGRYMRGPDGHYDIDITSDLTDGSDGALADGSPNSFQATPVTPPGTQPIQGDAKPVHQTPTKTDAVEPSLRDQLSSAFKGDDNKPTDQQTAQTAQSAAAVPALTKDGEGKYRNADGTFANADQIKAFETAGTPATADNTQQAQSPVLQGLTPVEAQQFQSLPAELRQMVERTMEGLNTRASRYGEYDQIEQNILGPRREAFAREGTNPVVALNQLFALSDFAGRDPASFVLWFADQHKIDLDAELDKRDAAQSTDPVVRQLQSEVQRLSGLVQNGQTQEQQQAQQARHKEVETFALEKDATTGALKRPYFTDVANDLMGYITAIRTANPQMPNVEVLDKAYQNACWGNPTIRAKMQESATANTRQQVQQRTESARAAGSSVTGGPAGVAGAAPSGGNLSLREELESQFQSARAV